MLDSILLIGKNNRDDKWLDMFTKSINKKENKKENILVNIIFDLDNGKVDFEPKKLDNQVAIEYRYTNKTFRGSQVPLPRLTFESDELKKGKKGDDLENIIEDVIKQAECMKKRLGNDLNGISYISLQELCELGTILNEVKNNLDRVNQQFDAYIKDPNTECFTISIKKNGHYRELAKDDLYIKFLKTYMKYPIELKKGICHICNEDKYVLTDPAFESGSLLKVYNVDKKGFISGISASDQSKLRTYVVCPECRLNLIIGNKYINNKLNFKINLYNIYVIPRISFVEYNNVLIDKLVNIIRGVTYHEGFTKLNEMLGNLDDLFQGWYTFTIIFGLRKLAAFDLEYFVQEVPITNIRRIYEVINDVTDKAVEYWNDKRSKWDLTLSGISNLFPFKNGKVVGRRPLIELLSSILQLHYYPINKLFEIAILGARIIHYNGDTSEKRGSKNSYSELVEGVIKFNYILLLLKELGMVDNTNSTNTNSSENITINDERIRKWIKTMQYNDLQTGLFMLGHLISQIGNAQYRRGDEKKSILDKIDFKGMKKAKILNLANEIPYHLRNYRILEYNEVNYYYMMELLNKSLNRLDEDPIGNLFYILSGYAYGTYNTITASNRSESSND